MRRFLVGILVALMGILTGLLATLLMDKPGGQEKHNVPQRAVKPLPPPRGPFLALETQQKPQDVSPPGAEDFSQLERATKRISEGQGSSDSPLGDEVTGKVLEAFDRPKQESPAEPVIASPNQAGDGALPKKPPPKKGSDLIPFRPRQSGVLRGGSEPRSSPQYALHVGSFKSQQTALKLIKRIEDLGLEAFEEIVEIPGKGEFHRVLVGKFQDKVSAHAELERLISGGTVKEGRVIELKRIRK